MKFSGIYGVSVGLLMLAQWTFFLVTGKVPELETEPLRILFHLAGEFITALGLFLTGVSLLRKKSWVKNLYLIFAGMAIYSEIVSPGYFAQQGEWALVAMFAVLFILAVVSVWPLLERGK